jgi:hypothetical protein
MPTGGKPPLGERMATVETWISEHDKVCAERYRLLIGVVGTAGLILISVAGWGLNQVHADQVRETQMLQGISAQIAHTTVTVTPAIVAP